MTSPSDRDDDARTGDVVPFPGGAKQGGAKQGSTPSDSSSGVDIGALFDAHAPYLCRVVHRLTGSAAAADDIVQEVFLVAYRRRHELEDRTGIRTWLYRVAVNHVRHGRRSHARYQRLLEGYKAHPDPTGKRPSPDEVTLRRQRGELIHACVQQLSDKQREVFVLYELEGLEGAEIAEILDLSTNTVWSRLRLARAAFRKHWSALVDLEDGL
jgi:RNA polymerase sigma-70 factor (ECF subfamily)